MLRFIIVNILLIPSLLFSQYVYTKATNAKPISAVIETEMYSPFILNCSDGYYYMTGILIGSETKLPLYKSKDLNNWEYEATILSTSSCLQSPKIYEFNNKFYLIVAIKEGITVYVSNKIENVFLKQNRLLENVNNASIFSEGYKKYILFDGDKICEISTDLTEVISGATTIHPSFNTERPKAPGWATEKEQFLRVGTNSPQMIKRNGKYYFFASANVTRLNDVMYDVLYSVSNNLFGNYSKRSLAFMHAGGGNIFKDKNQNWQIVFSAKARDKFCKITKRPVIVPLSFFNNDKMVGYSQDYYFEKEPIGNLVNRMPNVTMRDPSITAGPNGWYYLVHTENWVDTEFGKPRVLLRRSKDLINWEKVNYLIKTEDLGSQYNGKALGFKPGDKMNIWAPEIKYIQSKNVFLLALSIPKIPNDGGSQTWIFKGENPQGPFKNISTGAMHKGIDGFFFEDDDGKVYYLYGSNNIVEMNEELTGFKGEFKKLLGLHGIEGMSLIKISGKYVLTRSDNTGAPGTATYESIYGVSDNVFGPYDYKGSLPHCGHTTMFKGNDGKYRLTLFGSDSHAPIHHGLGILQFELDKNGKIILKEDK